MPEPHRKRPTIRIKAQDDAEPGFDVWVPALVAIAAAIFMIWHADAAEPTDTPRPIYDVSLFDEPVTSPEPGARLIPGAVEVAALPAIAPEPAAAPAPRPKPAPQAAFTLPELPGEEPVLTIPGNVVRLAAIAAIFLLLVGSLVALTRTWRRLPTVPV